MVVLVVLVVMTVVVLMVVPAGLVSWWLFAQS